MIHMKYQDLFSLKNKKIKILYCHLVQILLGVLRVKNHIFMGNGYNFRGDNSVKIDFARTEKESQRELIPCLLRVEPSSEGLGKYILIATFPVSVLIPFNTIWSVFSLIAFDKAHFKPNILIFFSYISIKKQQLIVGTHQKGLSEALLMYTHNICFYGKIRKTIIWIFLISRAILSMAFSLYSRRKWERIRF